MRILFYRESMNGAAQRLDREVEASIPSANRDTYCSIPDLLVGLRKLENLDATLVLLAETQKRLGDLLAIRELLEGHRTILILPDCEQA